MANMSAFCQLKSGPLEHAITLTFPPKNNTQMCQNGQSPTAQVTYVLTVLTASFIVFILILII